MVRAIRAGVKRQTRRVGARYERWEPGDLLWVRESFWVQPELWAESHGPQPIHYAADVQDPAEIEDYVKKPSIHMPRWASRLTLRLTANRREHIFDIALDDVAAEGFRTLIDFLMAWAALHPGLSPQTMVSALSFEVVQ